MSLIEESKIISHHFCTDDFFSTQLKYGACNFTVISAMTVCIIFTSLYNYVVWECIILYCCHQFICTCIWMFLSEINYQSINQCSSFWYFNFTHVCMIQMNFLLSYQRNLAQLTGNCNYFKILWFIACQIWSAYSRPRCMIFSALILKYVIPLALYLEFWYDKLLCAPPKMLWNCNCSGKNIIKETLATIQQP